MDSPITVKSYK
ncbi:hypothetical protein F383_29804 [Gossypium arboreum]|uniref:Uncharacterized protein n=1 Tax=Gossypium arboreum TaxID=29729 RepID=A0A0B0MR27_GOSAR|nr:hypothetical protein F383_29804 [Gossypium arboreum]